MDDYAYRFRMLMLGQQGRAASPYAAMGNQPASAATLQRMLSEADKRIADLEREVERLRTIEHRATLTPRTT